MQIGSTVISAADCDSEEECIKPVPIGAANCIAWCGPAPRPAIDLRSARGRRQRANDFRKIRRQERRVSAQTRRKTVVVNDLATAKAFRYHRARWAARGRHPVHPERTSYALQKPTSQDG